MEKVLLELLARMSNYAQKNNIPEGLEFQLQSDGSGGFLEYASKEEIFAFDNFEELLRILDEELV